MKTSAINSGQPAFYRAPVWRLGLFLARRLPPRLQAGMAGCMATLGWWLDAKRRAIVTANLLPVFDGDRSAAERAARSLFRQFALKVVDLLRFESGCSIEGLFTELTGWEHFVAAQQTQRGVLLVTPHLGNWEFGAPLLIQRGLPLKIVTVDEPGRLTGLRQAARARWGIETLVIGNDSFAFVNMIRQLEAGAMLALLMDRPAPPTAAPVKLFGRPFAASVAAAELARASGCTILPVIILRNQTGYAAHGFPAVAYERAVLRAPEARAELTQRIMSVFEPAIRQHADQWYHFVPLWTGRD